MSGGGSTNTVTRTELDPTMRPYVQYGLSEAQRLYQTPDMPSYYPGQTYISPSQQTQTALAAAQQRAMTGSPLVPAAQQQLMGTIQGQYAGINPYMEQALQPGFDAARRAYEGATSTALSNAARTGRYGSGAMQNALTSASGEYARALTGAAGALGYESYNAERQRQLAAAAAAPEMAAQDYSDINRLLNLGQTAEAYQEMALADAVNRFNFAQQAPYSRLQSFLSSAYGAPQGMQTVTPVYRSQLGNVLGGATTGAALGQMAGFSPGYGAAIGAGLGLLG